MENDAKFVAEGAAMLKRAAESLEKVFHDGASGFTTMNDFASDIFLLTTFVKHGNWEWKDK